jgi:hypothetical protein
VHQFKGDEGVDQEQDQGGDPEGRGDRPVQGQVDLGLKRLFPAWSWPGKSVTGAVFPPVA